MNTAHINLKEYIKDYHDQEKFLGLCTQCPNFNKRWSCPPYSFKPADLLSGFSDIYIFAHRINPNDDFKQQRKVLDENMLTLEMQYPNSLALYAGSCILCPECNKERGEACLYPDKVRYSLESLGFDVCKTTQKLLGIEIQWAENDKLPDYYTLVSALCTTQEIKL